MSSDARLSTRVALWAIPVSDLAGVARHAVDVAETGIPGWEVVFLTPPGDLPDALRAAGAAVVVHPFGPDHGLRASHASLRHCLRTIQPEVVHTHLSYADIVAALAVGRHPALVTTEHGIARDDLVYHHSSSKARVMAAAHTARLRRFDAAIAVSEATADAMRAKWHPSQQPVVIPNGVDPVDQPSREPGMRVLSLARLAPEKRLDRLVDAFARLHSAHPDATLTIAGTGPLLGALRQQVATLGLADAVTFPGYVDAVAAMSEHDVLAMLSVWENCSYALLDAAVAGLGVVASPVGGNPEILPAHCLADPDDPAAVAAALTLQATDLSRRPHLSGWPTRADMTARIATTYDAALGQP